jgi:hypothetical protein
MMLLISSREKGKYMSHILLWGHKLMMVVGSKCPKIQFTFKHNKGSTPSDLDYLSPVWIYVELKYI